MIWLIIYVLGIFVSWFVIGVFDPINIENDIGPTIICSLIWPVFLFISPFFIIYQIGKKYSDTIGKKVDDFIENFNKKENK